MLDYHRGMRSHQMEHVIKKPLQNNKKTKTNTWTPVPSFFFLFYYIESFPSYVFFDPPKLGSVLAFQFRTIPTLCRIFGLITIDPQTTQVWIARVNLHTGFSSLAQFHWLHSIDPRSSIDLGSSSLLNWQLEIRLYLKLTCYMWIFQGAGGPCP